MPGLFDGMNISVSGINAHRTRMEVVANNIANASNEDYTRQRVDLGTKGSIYDGQHFLGQGVQVDEIIRVRDELLDDQIRNSLSTNAKQEVLTKWLNKIEIIYNEPSDSGINNALSDFWESWSELANDPESFATRSNVIQSTEQLSDLLNTVASKLERYTDEIEQDLTQTIEQINDSIEEISQLNSEIFNLEAGNNAHANDLRDSRDAALNELAEMIAIDYKVDKNGMVNVYINEHPAVYETGYEKLITKSDPLDPGKMMVDWEFGARMPTPNSGQLGAILQIRDELIPAFQNDMDNFAKNLLSNVNNIYANGLASEPVTTMQSRLGYESLGVNNTSEVLGILETGETASIHFSFYDDEGSIVRSQGVIVDADDTLQDINLKLDSILGLDASLLTDPNHPGQFSFSQSTGNTDKFTLSNNTGAYDTSGVLSLVGFNPTAKTSSTTGAVTTFGQSLATDLGVDVSNLDSTALNLAGHFTLNVFETVTPGSDTTISGYNIAQMTVNVDSTDTLTDITTAINNAGATYGLSATLVFDGTDTYTMTVSGPVMTDADGNYSTTGTVATEFAFANVYTGPNILTDNPPKNYTGFGDDTNLFSTMQMNTLFQGENASDIALDSKIISAEKVHAGYQNQSGDNTMALDLIRLQHDRVTGNDQFTLDEEYQNAVATVGTEVEQAQALANNTNLMLQGFLNERDRISGVNLDEELASMILFQRAYEANARMFSTLDEMVEGLLRL